MRSLPRARTGLAVSAAVMLLALAGCDVMTFNQLDDGFVVDSRVTEISLGPGGSGDVTVRADETVTGADVRRTVRYRAGGPPAQTARVEGSRLMLDLDCGFDCSVSYTVALPPGTPVRGEVSSGDVTLNRVGDVDIRLSSGDIRVDGASGSVRLAANSGDVTLRSVSGDVVVETHSGDVEARDLRGDSVQVQARSGTVDLDYAGTGSVSASTNSGDITVRVPQNACRISAVTDSGDTAVRAGVNPAGACQVVAQAHSGDVTINPR